MQRILSRFQGLGLAAVGRTAYPTVGVGGMTAARAASSFTAPSSSTQQTLTSGSVRGSTTSLIPFAASCVGGVRTVTKGVGIFVGNDGDVDRAMRKLKRTMIGEGIIREQKKRRHFLKGAEKRVMAQTDREHRSWTRNLRRKMNWIIKRKDRGF